MNKQRLLKLAQHLETGQLGHETFDFNWINVNDRGMMPQGNVCGTAGCAMGELPIVWPDNWRFDSNSVELIGTDNWSYDQDVAEWFGLTEQEVDYLFVPSDYLIGDPQNPKNLLPVNATKDDVAKRIREFVTQSA